MATITRYPNSDYDVTHIIQDSYSTGCTPPEYQYVDETSYDDADWFKWGSDGVVLFGFSAPSVPTYATVNSVKVYWRAKDTGTTENSSAALRVGGTVYYGSNQVPASSYTTYSYTWTTNPKTGSAWVTSDVNTPGNTNGLQYLGMDGSYYHDGKTSYEVYCSWLKLEIDYTVNVPTVTTQDVTDIAGTTATGHGNVTSDGGDTIIERGVCWVAGTGTPTTSDSKATHTGTLGEYDPDMTGLSAATHYSVRAYAINGIGTAYGSKVEFDTLGGALLGSDGPGKTAGAAAWGFIS